MDFIVHWLESQYFQSFKFLFICEIYISCYIIKTKTKSEYIYITIIKVVTANSLCLIRKTFSSVSPPVFYFITFRNVIPSVSGVTIESKFDWYSHVEFFCQFYSKYLTHSQKYFGNRSLQVRKIHI